MAYSIDRNWFICAHQYSVSQKIADEIFLSTSSNRPTEHFSKIFHIQAQWEIWIATISYRTLSIGSDYWANELMLWLWLWIALRLQQTTRTWCGQASERGRLKARQFKASLPVGWTVSVCSTPAYTRYMHTQPTKIHFYRAKNFSAKRDIGIACCPSVRPSVYDVGGLWSHRLEILETNCTDT